SGGSSNDDTTRYISPRSATSSARPGFRRRDGRGAPMKVILRNPRREVEMVGGRRVKEVLRELDILPETVLVIRGDELITPDQVVRDADTIELRPVRGGGAREPRGKEKGHEGRSRVGAGRGPPGDGAGAASPGGMSRGIRGGAGAALVAGHPPNGPASRARVE